MPINNIPGVGPTNADIATAVAAPSAATIAAAVAAPSAATIAAAVAAPSSATIASAVAAAVPTINTSVATYAPSANNWVYLGTVAPSGVATAQFTGISGYKKLKVVGFVTCTSGYPLMTFNSDSTNNNYMSYQDGTSYYMSVNLSAYGREDSIILSPLVNAGNTVIVEISDANYTNVFKTTEMFSCALASVSRSTSRGIGIWKNTSAINTITFSNTGGAAMTGNFYLLGAN